MYWENAPGYPGSASTLGWAGLAGNCRPAPTMSLARCQGCKPSEPSSFVDYVDYVENYLLTILQLVKRIVDVVVVYFIES